MRYDGQPAKSLAVEADRAPRAGSIPMIDRIVVVLPMPFRPISVTTRRAARSDMPNSAWLPP